MAAEPLPPGRASGTSSGNRRGGRGQGQSHQVERGCGGSRRLGPPAGARRGGRRPRALVRGAREERPPLPALLRRPGFLPRERAARLAPRAATAAAEVPLSPAPGGESTSTGAYSQRAAADGSLRPARPLFAAA